MCVFSGFQRPTKGSRGEILQGAIMAILQDYCHNVQDVWCCLNPVFNLSYWASIIHKCLIPFLCKSRWRVAFNKDGLNKEQTYRSTCHTTVSFKMFYFLHRFYDELIIKCNANGKNKKWDFVSTLSVFWPPVTSPPKPPSAHDSHWARTTLFIQDQRLHHISLFLDYKILFSCTKSSWLHSAHGSLVRDIGVSMWARLIKRYKAVHTQCLCQLFSLHKSSKYITVLFDKSLLDQDMRVIYTVLVLKWSHPGVLWSRGISKQERAITSLQRETAASSIRDTDSPSASMDCWLFHVTSLFHYTDQRDF